MNCYEIKKLLELKRYDELTKEEVKSIDEYIRQCDGCSESLFASMEYDKMLVKMKKSIPILNDSEELTRTIMESTLKKNPTAQSVTLIDKILDIIEVAPVQYVLKTLLILIICFYFFEELSFTFKMSELENKYYSQTVSTAGIEAIIKTEISLINKLQNAYEMVLGEKDYLELGDEWVLMRSSEQKRIIGYYIGYILKDKYDKKELSELIKNLESIDFLDGLSEDEVKELDKHRELMQNEIKQIIPGGEGHE